MSQMLRTDTAENAECRRSWKVFGKGYGFSLCAVPFAIPYALIYQKMIGKRKVRTDSEVEAEMSRIVKNVNIRTEVRCTKS